MKKILYYILGKCFGKKRYHRFFLILKNISIQGLNYRNTDIQQNGELFLINKIANYYSNLKEIILFDVGANIGNYSKVLKETFPNAQIFAFEPFSIPFKNLAELSATNSNIKSFQIGLSDKEESLIIYSSDEYSEIGGVYNRDLIFHDIPHSKQEKSRFKTTENFCLENKIDHIHFMKIDVEGHELSVLKGALSFLENAQIDFIQFEFGAGNIFSRTYFTDFYSLLSKNYVLYRLLKDGLIPITSYNAELEMQILTYYVAISKKHASKFITNAS